MALLALLATDGPAAAEAVVAAGGVEAATEALRGPLIRSDGAASFVAGILVGCAQSEDGVRRMVEAKSAGLLREAIRSHSWRWERMWNNEVLEAARVLKAKEAEHRRGGRAGGEGATGAAGARGGGKKRGKEQQKKKGPDEAAATKPPPGQAASSGGREGFVGSYLDDWAARSARRKEFVEWIW